MSVQDKDESGRSPDQPSDAAPTPPGAGGDAPPPPPDAAARARRRGWRRVVNRRNAMWTAIVAVVAVVAIVFILFVLYRGGQVDRIISNQIVSTLATYNIRAEVGGVRTEIGPRTAVITDLKLYDATTGAPIGNVKRLTATVRIQDLWALRLSREVNLESLELDGLELWVTFDSEGRSNFSNIRLPEPQQNKRILFSYSTAVVRLNNAVVHFDDRQHVLSGEARNLRATVQPDDPNAPAESRMNRVEFALSDSTFVYDGRPVNDISVEGRARVDQQRAEVQELVLRSPVAEARLTGALDDWRAMRYRFDTVASVDLSQASNILKTEAALRGSGSFKGTVTGEGDRWNVKGDITSDALAADNVRLKALSVNLSAEGQGKNYEGQGRAVAELLTAGDFRLSAVQVAGGLTGTGTDFRWLGDLRAAALSNGSVTIANLILSDAVAELSGGNIEGGAKSFSAGGLTTTGAGGPTNVSGLEASGVAFKRDENGATTATAASARAGQVRTKDATVNNVAASGVAAGIAADGRTSVEVERLQVGGVVAAGARTGSLNIAGVRLSIYEGRVEGSSGDINVGTVAFRAQGRGSGAEGRAEGVRLARPVFVLEPSGRYRASMDVSLGGGVFGSMPLGAARAAVVATNDAIQLDNFDAQLLGGRAAGDATIALVPRAQSRVAAEFTNVDVGNLLLAFGNRQLPVAGAATGTVNLSFPGTRVDVASGTLNATFSGDTGDDTRGRTPLNGEVSLRADRGLFAVERANLRTAASELTAMGQFSFGGGSNLRVTLASSDASELQRVLVSSGLAPDLATQLERYKVALGGKLDFAGTLTGDFDRPAVNGRFSLESLALGGRDLGALSASVVTTEAEIQVAEGRLQGRDGGNVQFSATVPLSGENNIAVNATLERFNAGNLVAALTGSEGGAPAARLAGMGPASGSLNVTGLPGAMSGKANLRVGPGQINGEPLEELVARADFSGSEITLEALDARFRSGTVSASGRVGLGILNPEAGGNTTFDVRARGENVRLDILGTLLGGGTPLPALGGTADFTASAAGDLKDQQGVRVELNAKGRDVTINGRPAGELSLVGTTTTDRKFNLEFRTALIGTAERPQVFRATVDLSDEELPLTFNTNFDAADLTPLFAALLPGQDVRVTGRATGRVTAQTTILGDEGLLSEAGLGALRGEAVFTELVVNVNDTPISAVDPLEIDFTPNEITFRRTQFTGPDTNITFGGTTALREGGRQDLTLNGQLNLRFLNRLSPNILTSGTATVAVRVFGSFAAPRITGTAEVARGSFTAFVEDESLNFTNLNARVRFTADQAQIDTFEARLGGGRVTASGGALLEGLRPAQFRLSLRGDNVTVPFPDQFRTTADAVLELRGSSEAQLLEGEVTVRRSEYTEDIDLADLIERNRDADITETRAGGDAGGGLLSNLQLDLRVEGRDALVLRNNLADAVGSLSINARGSADDPVVAGRVTLSRGTINFRNNRFEITRGFIDLPPRRAADPLLNIQAESEIRGYRVIAGITGPLSQPVTNLRADPALPQVDVVSLILTGNLSSGGEQSASTLAQSGLGTATSLLTETLITNPVRKATDKLFGLNRLEIDPLIAGRGGASPTARLTIGRQITRDLSITYSTNVTTDQNQVLAVEYRVSDRLSFVAQYQQGALNSLRAQQNNFAFEIRFRKRF